MLSREKIMWWEKSKANWIKEGDANTRFFNVSTIILRKHSMIDMLQTSSDTWVTGWEHIEEQFGNSYKDLFKSSQPKFSIDLNSLVPISITEETNDNLFSVPIPEEIKNIVFSLSRGKSLGPNGISISFYKAY